MLVQKASHMLYTARQDTQAISSQVSDITSIAHAHADTRVWESLSQSMAYLDGEADPNAQHYTTNVQHCSQHRITQS